MWLNFVLLLQLSVIYVILLPHTYASPVGQTGPVLEAEGWTPVRNSQVVRIPQEYIDEDPNVNKLPLDRAFNEATVYNNYERTRFEGIEPESRNSFRPTGCNIKNGDCVPKCSELTEEELSKGTQCQLDDLVPNNEATEAPWEAVPPEYDVSDFGENQSSNNVFRSPVSPNHENIKQSQASTTEEYGQSGNSPSRESNGQIQKQYNSAEELEIQRQQAYSGFGEKIQTNVEQSGFKQQEKEVTQSLPNFQPQDIHSTEEVPSFQHENHEQLDLLPSLPLAEKEEIKPEKPPMIVYPAGSDQYQPPPSIGDREEPVVVQTASVVRPEKDQFKQRLPPFSQQGQFAPIPPPRSPHLRPHPPNRPPPHHPQKQQRPYPRRPVPPKRLSNIIPGGVIPQRPVINGRPPLLKGPPPPQRRPQPEALPRSSIAGPTDQFVSTQPKGPPLSQGRPQRPVAPVESRQVPSITPSGTPPSPESPPRRPLSRQPPPNRGRPRPPIRPRPNRRPQKGVLDRVREGLDRAKCGVKKFVSGQMLNDEQFIKKQINCVLDKGECDETGKMIKRLAPDVLNNKCPQPCTPCKKQQIKMMMSTIQRKHPKLFADVIRQVKTRN